MGQLDKKKPMEVNDDPQVLQVTMFRNFSAFYNGKRIVDAAGRSSQFVYLTQLLWYYQEEGVSRKLMMEAAFDGREPEDPSHALRNALYHVKFRLKKLGLPSVNYILKEGDTFFWNREIPLEVDTDRFNRLCHLAEAEEDRERKLKLLMDACFVYQGEFLSEYAGCLWISFEARRYRERFRDIVEEAARLLRESRDYYRLKALGEHAAKADPFSNWEVLIMEALCTLGKPEEASGLYARTADLYLSECGCFPSQKLKEYLGKLDNIREYSSRLLDNIQESLEEKDVEGGYVCSLQAFQNIYQILKRWAERGGYSACLMLCYVSGGEREDARETERASGKKCPGEADGPFPQSEPPLADKVCQAIKLTVRHGDVISRYGKNQYLILLDNISLEDCREVQRRINRSLHRLRSSFKTEYYMKNMLED